MKDGFLLIDKPVNLTSHDVVNIIRKKFRMRRIGHAGTLDPLATGLLIILVGKSTKLFNRFSSFDKGYRATLLLGLTTHTADINGKEIQRTFCGDVTEDRFKQVLVRFQGSIEQIPPMVSAVKHKGKRLYELARSGIEVERSARKITINELKILNWQPPEVDFYVHCSKGTYVRKIAEDIGEQLGCGACITKIRRTKIGYFDVKQAITLNEVHESYLQNWKY